jgi:predicted metal-dependent phosphotriesterase family hydrolase
MTPSLDLTRRAFLRNVALLTVAVSVNALPTSQAPDMFVQTVLGPIPASELGFTLVHEHVMCDFIGANQTNRHRWEVEAVVKRMLPLLRRLKERGVTGFIDCTAAYIGRDPRVLKQLAQETGLHIVTKTGYTVARTTNLCRSMLTAQRQINSLTSGSESGYTALKIPG